MAADPLAKPWTLPYADGSYTDAMGNLQYIFGEDFANLAVEPVRTEFTRAQHQRVRVIGEPATAVAQANVDYMRWPASVSGRAAGGEEIRWYDEDDNTWRTGRVSGTFSDFNAWVEENMILTRFEYRTARGTRYLIGNATDDIRSTENG